MPVIAATHTPVNSGRSATHAFGAGILPGRERRMPYTYQDTLDAAAMFADDSEPDWDSLAAQREWEAAYEAGLLSPVEFGLCLNCSTPSDDLTRAGLCDKCDDLATNASTASQNYAAGLGYRVH